MIRISTALAVALTLASAGPVMAQQDAGGASGQTDATVGAPASADTGVKGVYSLKSTMGISTGQADAGESGPAKPDAAESEEGDGEQASSD